MPSPTVPELSWLSKDIEYLENWGLDLLLLPRSAPAVAVSLDDWRGGSQRASAVVDESNAAAIAEQLTSNLVGPHAALAREVAALSITFLSTFRQPSANIRLEILTDTKCPRLHVDAVHMRLLCTYTGEGTEYAYRSTPAQLMRVPTGALAFFKGSCHPTFTGHIVHRSPPAVPGSPRLVLTIDY